MPRFGTLTLTVTLPDKVYQECNDTTGNATANQDDRLSLLLDNQQGGTLSKRERGELSALMELYQEGLLRKAQGLREAVKRGLIKPLAP